MQPTAAWPYVDCTGANPIFGLTAVNAYFDSMDKTLTLAIRGNFTNLYQYPSAETSQ
ncbi:hypothetical protein BGZ65_005621, partial [Modicella reniformis]